MDGGGRDERQDRVKKQFAKTVTRLPQVTQRRKPSRRGTVGGARPRLVPKCDALCCDRRHQSIADLVFTGGCAVVEGGAMWEVCTCMDTMLDK